MSHNSFYEFLCYLSFSNVVIIMLTLLVAILGSGVIASASIDIPQHEVRIVSDGPVCEHPNDVHTISDAKGRPFTCCIPAMIASDSSSSQPPEHPIDARLRHAAARLKDLLAADGALLRRFGHWTYEITPGSAVRQFHEPVGTLQLADGMEKYRSGQAAAARARATTEFSLGSYQSGKDELLADETGNLVLRQHYSAGSGGRSAAVDFTCAGSSGGSGEAADLPLGLSLGIAGVAEDVASATYVVTVAARDPQLCEQLVPVSAALRPINGTCARHTEGWWTNEVCVGRHVRQWHEMSGGGSGPAGSSNSDSDSPPSKSMPVSTRVQESDLGLYAWAAGDVVETGVPGKPPAIVQRYTHGTPCDLLRGSPRETVLRLECAPLATRPGAGASSASSGGSGNSEIWLPHGSINEPSTCRYSVTIRSPALCAHPELSPPHSIAQAAPPRIVTCSPLHLSLHLAEDRDSGAAAQGGAGAAASAVNAKVKAPA